MTLCDLVVIVQGVLFSVVFLVSGGGSFPDDSSDAPPPPTSWDSGPFIIPSPESALDSLLTNRQQK